MPRGRKATRKTRVTKAQVRALQEERKKKVRGRKNKIIPGPWTEIEPEFKVKASLRWGDGIMGKTRGTYPSVDMWVEKSWYPIILNITSRDIKSKVEKHGLDNYMAAAEKSINDSKAKIKDHGHIVLLTASVDNSQREDKDRRFISCHGKTNKKSIPGFTATRTVKGENGKAKRSYIIIPEVKK